MIISWLNLMILIYGGKRMEYADRNKKQQIVFRSTQKKQLTGMSNQTLLQRRNLTGIPDTLKQKAEENTGISFDDVKVHYNSDKPASVQALAYTQGSDVYIASGQEKHLVHELGHVVQQKEGRVVATNEVNGFALNDDISLEKEADYLIEKKNI